jgi:hypothetical protein
MADLTYVSFSAEDRREILSFAQDWNGAAKDGHGAFSPAETMAARFIREGVDVRRVIESTEETESLPALSVTYEVTPADEDEHPEGGWIEIVRTVMVVAARRPQRHTLWRETVASLPPHAAQELCVDFVRVLAGYYRPQQ